MTSFFPQKMVPECKPEWNREAKTVFSRIHSLMAADKPCPQLQTSLMRTDSLKEPFLTSMILDFGNNFNYSKLVDT